MLYRYTGQKEIPLGYSIYENLSQPANGLKIGVSGELIFKKLKDSVRQQLTESIEPNGLSSQVQLTINETSNDEVITKSSHATESLRQSLDSELADLHLIVLQSHDSTIVSIEYNGNSFLQNSIQQFGRHFENLLLSAIETDATQVADLNLFTEEEEDWYIKFSKVGQNILPCKQVHEEIEMHASKNPDKVAVTSNNRSITYGYLNTRSNQLAHFLLGKGVKSESRIMVCMEASEDIAIALLAILKAGATYVPLNASHPEYRIKKIIEDVKPDLVITHSVIEQTLAFGNVSVIAIDTSEELDHQETKNPNQVIELSQTAYIYYTSGTTGLPKGSLGSYGNLNHYLRVAQERYGFNSADIMPALASYSFSISMFELLSPLLAGATLAIVERRDILDAEVMVEMLQKVTFVHAGPSLLKSLVKYIHKNVNDYSVFNGLRHLSSGGDMVPPDLLRNLQLIFRNTELYVIYGCSEIACMGFTYRVDPIVPIERTYVGKPFNNVALMLLDKEGNRVPIGVSGEVCIGGNGVASGYLNRPELTEEKFFVFDSTRFYRTGDVGRLNGEGNLELLGREDFQIQIHGMRVELGEVEYNLRQIPAVRDAVVIARSQGRVKNTLVAFYVKNGNYRLDPESLRKYMTQHVPDYMVPSFYVQLDSLPLNINMKVDRSALSNQDLSFIHSGRKPETESELEMAKIWQDLLKIENVGIYDNFLAIGGDSLLAMELINLVSEQMGVKLNGLDILRESLHVLAANCDVELGRSSTIVENDKRDFQNLNINRIESFFFGSGNELYGLQHPAAGNSKSAAVLICPPLGGEHKRCCFLLKLLADSISSLGTPVMRFDYYGTGDAQGACFEATMARWITDVTQAYEELKVRSGCQNVIVLAVRFGAVLAGKSLGDLSNVDWILWDPIVSGEDYYSKLHHMHKRKIWRSKVLKNIRKPVAIDGGEELMGSTYSDLAVKQMRKLAIGEGDFHNVNIKSLLTLTKDDTWNSYPFSGTSSNYLLEQLNLDVGWYNPDKTRSAITHSQILNKLISLVSKSIQ